MGVLVSHFARGVTSMQGADGRWGGAAWNHGWDSTMHVLTLLREMGLDPASDQAMRALDLVRQKVTWKGCGPEECDNNSFFEGELEPCINGQVGASGAYFRQDVHALVERLLTEQLSDGGWNCEAVNGSTRSSFNTTICVLEALLEYELSFGGAPVLSLGILPALKAARKRGENYLLDRKLFRRLSTGAVIDRDMKSTPLAEHGVGNGRGKNHPAFTLFAFPTWWHYDVLRGLDYMRRAGVPPDPRMTEAIDLVLSKRDGDGLWPLEILYPGTMLVETDEGPGRPSRWNTLRALRVLKWYSHGSS